MTKCWVFHFYSYAEYHYAECHYAECHYAECHMLNVIMLNVIMLNVIMLNVIMLNVMAPFGKFFHNIIFKTHPLSMLPPSGEGWELTCIYRVTVLNKNAITYKHFIHLNPN
jgi:hypothetical protein